MASLSQSYAKTFARERSKSEHRAVKIAPLNFDKRPGIEPGNIAQVALYAGSGDNAVPWIYNEVGGIGFNKLQEGAYVTGLVNAIEHCLPYR